MSILPGNNLKYFFIILFISLVGALILFNKDTDPNILLMDPVEMPTEVDVELSKNLLKQYENKGTYINFPHKSIAVYYKDLGVSFNYSEIDEYFENCIEIDAGCDTEPAKVLNNLGNSLIQIDQNILDEYVDNLNQEVSSLLYSPAISFNNLTFRAYDRSSVISVEESRLREQLTFQTIFTDDPINISTKIDSKNPESQKIETLNLMDKAFNESLLIKYGREPVSISPEELRGFGKTFVNESGDTYIQIDKSSIESYINSLTNQYDLEVDLEYNKAVLSIAYALLFRVSGENPNTAVILPLKGLSETDGTYDQGKYLEINKSQQRMYAFENGELVDTYIIGTGLTWETPAGEFKILRKEGTAISYSGGWYMPYYMPIGTVNGLFFGFHEIPYKLTAEGNITSRDVNTMGSPATGGCIQLYREDAKKLYDWTDIGTKVVIYE